MNELIIKDTSADHMSNSKFPQNTFVVKSKDGNHLIGVSDREEDCASINIMNLSTGHCWYCNRGDIETHLNSVFKDGYKIMNAELIIKD